MRKLYLLAVVAAVAACTPDYPFDKPGTWSLESRPSSNDENLHAMLVDPHDLIEGRSASVSLSAQAAPAVARLLVGQPASAQGTGNLTTGANSPPVQPTSQQPATAQ